MLNVPSGEGWREMALAPRNSLTYVEVWNGRAVFKAHHTNGGGGDDQPPFGAGWYTPVYDRDGKVLFMDRVTPAPTHWRSYAEEKAPRP